MTLARYFWPFFLTLAAGLGLSFVLGMRAGGIVAAIAALQSTIILSSLESSQSLDNVMVVSKIIKKMQPRWQNYYRIYGFLIGLVGMRFLMPIGLVSLIGWINPIEATHMAFYDQKRYAALLEGAEPMIMSFGGAFLGLLATQKYFLAPDRTESWAFYEKPLMRLSGMASLPYMFILLVLIISTIFEPTQIQHGCLMAGLSGVLAYSFVQDVIGAAAERLTEKGGNMGGLMSLLYAELVDASFSFDGVISAFAVTTDILIITIGLAIGAMLTRCLIFANIKTGLVAKLPHLDAGAYTSIWLLAMLMFLKNTNLWAIPDFVTGCLGIVIIGISAITSVMAIRREKREANAD